MYFQKQKQTICEWLVILNSINKYKAKKLLWGIADSNSNFKKFLIENNITQIKSDTLEDIYKIIPNSSIMFGFIQYFDKIQKQKVKQFEKQMNKVFDQFNYYGANWDISKEVRITIPNQRLSKIAQDIDNFQQKHGKFTKISNESRAKSKAIDNLCIRLSKNPVPLL